MLAVVPLRGFESAKSRLDAAVPPGSRPRIAAAIAGRVVAACREADWSVLVVAAAPEVVRWCRDLSLESIPDPGGGLDAAATAGIATTGGAWALIHGDLPLVTAADLDGIASASSRATILAPSRDGGTNLIAGRGEFRFAFGPGSFARHIATAADRLPEVLIRPGLAIELDTPADLAAVIRHPEGRWLLAYLS